MGPRPCGRGNQRRPVRSPLVCPRFNGAAALRPRKYRLRSEIEGRTTWLQWGRGLAAAEIMGDVSGAQDIMLLQWGRGLAAAEMPVSGATAGPAYAASMGPRPCGRGNNRLIGRRRLHYGASMGPRPCGRGLAAAEILSYSVYGDVVSLGFNGAAALRPRKSLRRLPARPPSLRASMGPRPCGRGNPAREDVFFADCLMLQWGRGLAAAEISFQRVGSGGPRRRLQWGRGLAAAEIRKRSARMPWQSRLQWGRGLAAAEMARFRQRRRTGSIWLQWGRGLAAAEMMRSRSTRRSTVRRLQWGRGLAAAEIFLSGCQKARQIDASMGPRPCGRGNLSPGDLCSQSAPGFNGAAALRPRKSAEEWAAQKEALVLQWGRGLAAAEIIGSKVVRWIPERLQWGRGLAAAEISVVQFGF